MRYYSKNFYVAKLIADYGDIHDMVDVGEFENYEDALLIMRKYYETIAKNIDDAWVIGEIQVINKYRGKCDLVKLESWNMKTGNKLEIKKED